MPLYSATVSTYSADASAADTEVSWNSAKHYIPFKTKDARAIPSTTKVPSLLQRGGCTVWKKRVLNWLLCPPSML
jgi:hypothetical protein